MIKQPTTPESPKTSKKSPKSPASAKPTKVPAPATYESLRGALKDVVDDDFIELMYEFRHGKKRPVSE